MKNLDQLQLEQMQKMVASNQKVTWESEDIQAKYEFIAKVLKTQAYLKLNRRAKGIVRRFLEKVTGISHSQLSRLIGQWRQDRQIVRRKPVRPKFSVRYTPADVALLAATDAAHEDLSGPALRRILSREFEVYGRSEYERLAGISVSHLYNLRRSEAYRRERVRVHHTQSRQIPIGERRKPDPQGQPGFLRVDTVHQGQKDGKPGVYYINSVDTVTQWQNVGCVETIGERHMIPVLEAILHQFPFRIRGFHCDNGSEFLNHRVAKLLNKLLVEFTKSRAYRTTDNALVEGKNGAVVRKHIGYGFIASEHADSLQRFFVAQFNPYLNFHRPCGFAVLKKGPRGRIRRSYPAEGYCTPYEKLCSLENWQQYLKPGVHEKELQEQAMKCSDTEAAKRMQKAKLSVLQQARLQS